MRVHLFAVPFREAMLLSITSGDWCLARVHVLRFYLDERDKKMWGVPQTLERAACKVEKVISFDLVTLADRLTRQKCVCVCVCTRHGHIALGRPQGIRTIATYTPGFWKI